MERLVLGSRWLLVPLAHDALDVTRMLTLTAVHLAFVVSALILAFVDKIAFSAHRNDAH
jgi:uncharacterized membrane protein YqhA